MKRTLVSELQILGRMVVNGFCRRISPLDMKHKYQWFLNVIIYRRGPHLNDFYGMRTRNCEINIRIVFIFKVVRLGSSSRLGLYFKDFNFLDSLNSRSFLMCFFGHFIR